MGEDVKGAITDAKWHVCAGRRTAFRWNHGMDCRRAPLDFISLTLERFYSMTHPKTSVGPTPTFSMQPVRYDDGSWGVSVQVTGLASKQQAEAAMQHMQRLFCGAEISSN